MPDLPVAVGFAGVYPSTAATAPGGRRAIGEDG